MLRRLFLLIAAALPGPLPALAAHPVPARNLELRAHLNEYPSPPAGFPYAYSACWSYVHGDGREYAVLGVTTGTAIYNVSDPSAPYRVAFIPGPNSIWREFKSYREWIYVVTEGVGPLQGLQVIRMSNPEAPVLAATYATGFVRSHTVAVDTARALLVCNGTRDAAGVNVGLHVLSIANPEAPVELSRWPAAPYDVPPDLYVHDSVPVGDRLYASSIYTGTQRILDLGDPAAPAPFSSWSYPGAGLTHNAWPNAAGTHLYVTDEQNGQPLRVFDISDPAAPVLVNTLTSNPVAIVHNAHVKGGDLWLSNYTEGIRALDLTDPGHPAEFGWADTYPGPSGGYGGVWEVCPFFPSGTVVASDMQTGLYVFRVIRDYGVVRVHVVEQGTGTRLEGVRVRLATQGDSLDTPADGIVQFAPSPGSHEVGAAPFGFDPASTQVTVSAGSRDTVTLSLRRRPTVDFAVSVTDAATSGPLGDAELRLLGTHLHGHTGADGGAVLAGVPDDVYRLEVARAGYAPLTIERRIGPGFASQSVALGPAALYDPLEDGFGWSAAAPGDSGNGAWTRVQPLGTGPRPPASGAEAAAARRAWTSPLTAGAGFGWRDAVPVDAQHEEPAAAATDNAAPYADHTPGSGSWCFVTGQGTDSLDVDQADVDAGHTTLTTPRLDMTGVADPVVGWWQWFYSRHPGTGQPDEADRLQVLISNDDGGSWMPVETTRGVRNHWEPRGLRVADHVAPNSFVRLRFVAADWGPPSTVEAAVDDLVIHEAADGTTSSGAPAPLRAPRFRTPWPNPARGRVALALELPAAGEVEIEVLDVAGRSIATLHRGRADAGVLQLEWGGSDRAGRAAPAGLYFVRASAAGVDASARFVLAR